MNKFILFIILSVQCFTAVMAQTVEIGYLKYDLDWPYHPNDGYSNDRVTAVVGFSDKYKDAKILDVSDLVIPESITVDGVSHPVKVIANYAFFSYPKLDKIVVPGSVVQICGPQFKACNYSNWDYDGPFVFIEDGDLYELDPCAFYFSDIIKIRLPKQLRTIGAQSFAHSDIDNFIIPPRVQQIRASALEGDIRGASHLICPPSMSALTAHFHQLLESMVFVGSPYISRNNGGERFNYNYTITCESPTPSIIDTNALGSGTYVYVPKGYESIYNDIRCEYTSDDNTYSINDWSKFNIKPYDNSVIIYIEGNGQVYADGEEVHDGEKLMSYARQLYFEPGLGHKLKSCYIVSDTGGKYVPVNMLCKIDFRRYESITFTFSKDTSASENDYASITVKDCQTHATTHYYPTGESATIDLTPLNDNTIESVIFNGTDVTGQITDTNKFTTTPLYGNNSLTVNVKDPAKGND